MEAFPRPDVTTDIKFLITRCLGLPKISIARIPLAWRMACAGVDATSFRRQKQRGGSIAQPWQPSPDPDVQLSGS